jgi:hypothetical protein
VSIKKSSLTGVNGWLSRIFLAEAIDATWSCGYTSAKGEGEKKGWWSSLACEFRFYRPAPVTYLKVRRNDEKW